MRFPIQLFSLFVLFSPLACSDGAGPGDQPAGSGGHDGGLATGGASGGGGNQLGSGGSFSSTGGSNNSGGSATGGLSNGSGGENPSSGAGGGETDGSGGEPSAMSNPSPGCGKSGRPQGGRVYQANEYWFIFPEKYDGTTPLPVLWGWHGCGSYNFGDANRTEWYDETRNSGFEDDYVVVAPLSASGSGSGCFNYNADMTRAKAYYDELVENYCVDLDRMFGTGHSSGANFLHQMLQDNNKADWDHFNLRGIAPVASGNVNNQTTQVPVLYMHSPSEGVDPGDAVDDFRSGNQCGAQSSSYEVDACNSLDGGGAVNANCISYADCSTETIWCGHDDPNYGGTYHGIPCFFRQAAYDFFERL